MMAQTPKLPFNPAVVALRIEKVYADVSLQEIQEHGSPRDKVLFEIRCSLAHACYTYVAATSKSPSKSQLNLSMAVGTVGSASA